MHTAHGRALAVATGVKLADPSLHVIVVMGDGDCAAIGGNHLIHAARRNVDLTAVVFNNAIYGMTGGQMGPTTHEGDMSKTSPFGNPEPAFDICELGRAAGATYVARATAYGYLRMVQLLAGGLSTAASRWSRSCRTCPTYYGRLNSSADPVEMMRLPEAPGGAGGASYENGTAARSPTSFPWACCITWNARSTPRPIEEVRQRAQQAV